MRFLHQCPKSGEFQPVWLWIRRKRHDLLGGDTTLDENDEEVEADILPTWWRQQDAKPGQEAAARPPDPPGGPVSAVLQGKSPTTALPGTRPSFVEGEVVSVSGQGPQSPIWPPTPLRGEPGSPVLQLVSLKSVPGLAGWVDALSTLTQIFCCIKSYT